MVFIFDENYSPKLAEGLHLLEQGNTKNKPVVEIWHILSLAKELGINPENPDSSYMDEEVIKIAGQKKGIILTQDKDFKRIKHLYPLFRDYKVGVVFFKTSKGSIGYWEIITSFIKGWNGLKKQIQQDATPFCYCVTEKGVTKMQFK